MLKVKTDLIHRKGEKVNFTTPKAAFIIHFDAAGEALIKDEFRAHIEHLQHTGAGLYIVEQASADQSSEQLKEVQVIASTDTQLNVTKSETEGSMIDAESRNQGELSTSSDNADIDLAIDLEKMTVAELHTFIEQVQAENPDLSFQKSDWSGLKKADLIQFIKTRVLE